MATPKELYTFHDTISLTDSNGEVVGTSMISYEIRRYRDLRNLGDRLAYQVLCTQRIVIPNKKKYEPGAQNVTTFADYPAVITNQIQFPEGSEIIDYSPRTINSSVVTSVSSGSGTSASATHQHTSGSSTSQSNSFGASASLGFFGDALTGGVSVDYDHRSGSASSNSASAGTGTGSSRQMSSGDSMSVKDWACYTYLSLRTTAPSLTWVWGQEYPWDVIRFRNDQSTTLSSIVLPGYVSSLLYDGTQLFPPSQLSLFGVDFSMSSVWIVEASPGESLAVTHTMNYYTASHQLGSNDAVAAEIGSSTPVTYPPPASPAPVIDLCTYGLDPILNDAAHAAIVGFVPRRFQGPPSAVAVRSSGTGFTGPTQFTIISSSNNLLIQDITAYGSPTWTTEDLGAGFTPSPTALTAMFTTNCPSLQMKMSFKVIDAVTSYKLFMKHWKTHSTGVELKIVINGDTFITKYVDDKEAEGGEGNLMSISLRNLDYGSVDYHDFLQLGLNTILITLTPVVSGTPCGYHLRAVSIESE